MPVRMNPDEHPSVRAHPYGREGAIRGDDASAYGALSSPQAVPGSERFFGGSTSPRLIAWTMACVRSGWPSLASMWLTCVFTVGSLIQRRCPIWRRCAPPWPGCLSISGPEGAEAFSTELWCLGAFAVLSVFLASLRVRRSMPSG